MLKGRRIILTGASSGIGAEICRLVADNNQVLAVSRNTASIIDHPNVTKYSCDISKHENIDAMFGEAFRLMGDVDLFIANAGFAYYELLEKPDWDHIDTIFRTNVFSVIYCLTALRERKKNDAFNFIITASAMSLSAMPGYALYTGTKFALKGFADAYRYELSPGQHLQMVYPIATITSFFKVAGSGKLPWPRQRADVVAGVIVRAIERNKKNVFPSRLYRIMLFLNRFLPIIPIYMGMEAGKLEEIRKAQ